MHRSERCEQMAASFVAAMLSNPTINSSCPIEQLAKQAVDIAIAVINEIEDRDDIMTKPKRPERLSGEKPSVITVRTG